MFDGLTFCNIFAILVYGGILYVRRQIIKRRSHDNVDIPAFLVGGEYPVDNSISESMPDGSEVCLIYTLCK